MASPQQQWILYFLGVLEEDGVKMISHVVLGRYAEGVLDDVKSGARVTVHRAGEAVAVLVPVAELAELDKARARLTVVGPSPDRPVPFPDARDLLERSLKGLGRIISRRQAGVRWHAVGRLTGLGSTYASLVCAAFDFNPDEEIGPSEWAAFEELFGESFDEERWEEITGEDPPPESERGRLDDPAEEIS